MPRYQLKDHQIGFPVIDQRVRVGEQYYAFSPMV